MSKPVDLNLCDLRGGLWTLRRMTPNLKNWQIVAIQVSKLQILKRNSEDFSETSLRVCSSNGIAKSWFKNFMHIEWRSAVREETFSKGIVGDKKRLRFRNKNQKIDCVFMQLACYD